MNDLRSQRFDPTMLYGLGISLWFLGALTGEGLTLVGFAIGALAALISGWRQWKDLGMQRLWPSWIGLALLLHIGWTLLSALWAPRPLASGAPWFALHLLGFPLAQMGWAQLGGKAQERLLRGGALVLAGSAVLALVQHFVSLDYGAQLALWRPVHRMAEPAKWGAGYMAGGLHFHRLKFAHTTVVLCLAAWPWRFEIIPWRLVRWIFGLLVLCALGATFARASWFALGAGALALGAAHIWPHRARIFLGSVCMLGAALPPALAWLGRGPADRLLAWQRALALWWQSPVLGVGAGGMPEATLAQFGQHPIWGNLHWDAHALGLQVLAERGLVGALTLGVWGFGFFVLQGKKTGAPTPAQVGVAAAVAVLGWVHNLAFHPLVWLAVALAWGMGGEKNHRDLEVLR